MHADAAHHYPKQKYKCITYIYDKENGIELHAAYTVRVCHTWFSFDAFIKERPPKSKK